MDLKIESNTKTKVTNMADLNVNSGSSNTDGLNIYPRGKNSELREQSCTESNDVKKSSKPQELSKMVSISISVIKHGSIKLNVPDNMCFEDVVIRVCQILEINPIARHLFSLRLPDTQTSKSRSQIWLSLSSEIKDVKNTDFEFRIRYNVPDLNILQYLDMKAYDYYFNQAKQDLFTNSVPELNFHQNVSIIIGLCVVDMYRAIIEEGLSKEQVLKDYKKFIPMKEIKKPWIFLGKQVKKKLNQITKNLSIFFVKSGYLGQFKKIAPNYLTEYYKCMYSEDCDKQHFVDVRINPYHETQPGISLKKENSNEWEHVCAIDDLCYLTIRKEGNVEISRKTGIPIYMKFFLLSEMLSFTSVLDGYYRLGVKWTFNICNDLRTPSLQKLWHLKCHGPISGEFAYSKLAEKRDNAEGCYILRESDIAYDAYFIDVCCEPNSKPVTYKIDKKDDIYRINDGPACYPSLQDLINDHKSGDKEFFLKECLPPSEFDQSNLLICQDPKVRRSENSIDLPIKTPVCINPKTLSVFKSKPQSGSCPYTLIYRGMWTYKNVKRNVVFKLLKEEYQDEHLAEFLSLAGNWAFAGSNSVVKFFGVTLSSPITMIMEYLSLGPFDVYLSNRRNRNSFKEVDLVEACTCLANALYYLEDAGFVHGKIRCRKLLVASHDDNSLIVKLSDPGLHHGYTDIETHWIPPECYDNVDQIRSSSLADMWAFGTTLWEIFSYGELPPVANATFLKNFYQSGNNLAQPQKCPENIYHLMTECWSVDPYHRKKPQAAMRDMNQILYQVYNARQNHAYSVITPRLTDFQSDAASDKSKESDDKCSSLFSELTLNTFLDDDPSCGMNENNSVSTVLGYSPVNFQNDAEKLTFNNQKNISKTENSISSLQSIYELDQEWKVVLNGRIGQGHYGEVYKGTMFHHYEEGEQLKVAVKKLKPETISMSVQADFGREIKIMLKLKHPNIISIKGIIREPDLCIILDYMEHGALNSYLNIYRERLTSHHLLKYMLDVAKGMAYLTDKKIVHRDLAARNILVVNEYLVQISDFGLAQFIGNNNYYLYKTERDLPIAWYAPESLEFGKFSSQSDVWSYGVTLYEMFTYGGEPRLLIESVDVNHICEALKKGIRLPCPAKCPHHIFHNIMSRCWQYNAADRPTFRLLCESIEEFFQPVERFQKVPILSEDKRQ